MKPQQTYTRSDEQLERDISHYLALPYSFEVRINADQSWFAMARDFQIIVDAKPTAEAALSDLQDEVKQHIRLSLQNGIPIPAPAVHKGYSGKVGVRIPTTLHRDVAARAKSEGVSLNQFVISVLSGIVMPGYRMLTRIPANAADDGRGSSAPTAQSEGVQGVPGRTVLIDGASGRIVVGPVHAISPLAPGDPTDSEFSNCLVRAADTYVLDPRSSTITYGASTVRLDNFARTVHHERRGRTIPGRTSEPDTVEYSGNFQVRLPRSLHRELVQLAEREEVSLNQVISSALSKAVAPANKAVAVMQSHVVVVDGNTGRIVVGPVDEIFRDDFVPDWTAVTDETLVIDPEAHVAGYAHQRIDLKQVYSPAPTRRIKRSTKRQTA